MQNYKGVIAFDVDNTLAFPGARFPGHVQIGLVAQLRAARYITGLCGNYQDVISKWPDWWQYFSFFGPRWPGITMLNRTVNKNKQLSDLKKVIRADRYVMVGNRRGDPDALPGSQDDVQARLAGWEFVEETDFVIGKF